MPFDMKTILDSHVGYILISLPLHVQLHLDGCLTWSRHQMGLKVAVVANRVSSMWMPGMQLYTRCCSTAQLETVQQDMRLQVCKWH